MTQLVICNQALQRLGAEPINDITDTSKRARLVVGQYDVSLKEMLYDTTLDHNWKFAIHRVQLDADSTEPLFGFTTRYKKPADCLKVISINVTGNDFTEEGDYILTQLSGTDIIDLKYLRYVDDTTKFGPLFSKALGLHIAFEIAFALTQDKDLRGKIEVEADNIKRKAVIREAYSAQPEDFYYDNSAAAVRY